MFDASLTRPAPAAARFSSPRSRSSTGASTWISLAIVTGAAALCPTFVRYSDQRQTEARLSDAATMVDSACTTAVAFSLPVLPVLPGGASGGPLASWQTIGGCGAGGSGSGGASIKWVGRNVHGGLFNVIQTTGYTHLYNDPASQDFHGGFNFSSSTQISTDVGERWNAGIVIPYLYKVYRDFKPNPQLGFRRDIANGGLGDISLMLLRKFGAINDTVATLSLGLPTGTYKEEIDASPLSQESQLGFGKPNASLTIDHAFDEIWGLFVVGGNASYRGGRNEKESYRAPSGSLYSFVGFYAGSLVPSFGLTLTGFQKHDQDINIDQNTPLVTLAPSAAIEWSSDYVAFLLGGSLPFGSSLNGKYAKLPWVMSFGISISPF